MLFVLLYGEAEKRSLSGNFVYEKIFRFKAEHAKSDFVQPNCKTDCIFYIVIRERGGRYCNAVYSDSVKLVAGGSEMTECLPAL